MDRRTSGILVLDYCIVHLWSMHTYKQSMYSKTHDMAHGRTYIAALAARLGTCREAGGGTWPARGAACPASAPSLRPSFAHARAHSHIRRRRSALTRRARKHTPTPGVVPGSPLVAGDFALVEMFFARGEDRRRDLARHVVADEDGKDADIDIDLADYDL